MSSDFVMMLIVIGVVLICTLGVKYLLDKYLIDRIKVIYKLISSTKLTSEEKRSIKTEEMSLDDVRTDVEQWANETNQQIEQLQSLENYRKEYIGNVSHELKTPVFALQGYLHSLLDGGMYEEKINKLYIEKAAKNADRLSKIIDDLESIHQLENQVEDSEYQSFDVKSLVQEVYEELQRMAEKKGIKLTFGDGATSNYRVLADRDEINRVFVNLVSNAIKYGKSDGVVKTSFYSVQEEILIEVTDDGIGIEDKHLKHLFDRFYRVDTARSRKEGGSGLGLSLVKHIIESHGYTISVRSRYNVGTTFSFMLKRST